MSRTTPWSNIQSTSSTGANANLRDFTVPTSHEWEVLAVRASLVCSSITSTRLLAISIIDGLASSNVFAEFRAGNTLSSASSGTVQWGSGLPNDTAFTNEYMHRAMPESLGLSAGQILRVHDVNGISTLDDLNAFVIYRDHAD